MKDAVKDTAKGAAKNLLNGALRETLNDGRKTLRLFVVGVILCTAGLSMVVGMEHHAADSLRREIAVLIALGIAGLGFITAMGAHLCLLLQRLRR